MVYAPASTCRPALVRTASAVVIGLVLAAGSLLPSSAAGQATRSTAKAKLTLRARPQMATAPARIAFSGALTGGADSAEEFYCPEIEWVWGDDTQSSTRADCAPYDANTAQVQRRFTAEHTYTRAGTYRVYLRLKQRGHDVAAASVSLEVQSGLTGPDF